MTPKHFEEWLSQKEFDREDKRSLIVNELSAEFLSDQKVQALYSRYENAAIFFAKFAEAHKLEYCFIKAFRMYKHFNTDINISISEKNFTYVIEELQKLGWSKRGAWSRFKENIAENGKRKLTHRFDNNIADIHLYPGLSWHGLNYMNFDDIIINSKILDIDSVKLYNTDYGLDLLSNVGHALFERYKLTAGEVFHLGSVLRLISDAQLEQAKVLALKNGWGRSFEDCLQLVYDLYNEDKGYFPFILPKKLVRSARNERISFHFKKRNFKSLILELLMTQIWSGKIYALYSRTKKIINGKTGEEAKYGAFE